MKKLFVVFTLFIITVNASGQAATQAVKFTDAIISRYTPTINAMTSKGWEYSNTIITHGIEKVYDDVPTASYLNYIKAYVDLYVDASGNLTASLVSLDRIHPGISCLFLYEKTGLVRYKTAATKLRNVLVGASATYSKTWNGIFWHKLSGYDNIVMLDGIYMAHPFLAKYGSMFSDAAAMDTAINQTLFVYNQLYDPTTHLIKHAWNATKSLPWANATTGNSTSVWSRAMGWYVMALVDILKYVPAAHPRRAELLTALSNLAIGIKTYQDATTGLWYQVVDKGTSLSGNYLESSGSGMFVYAIKTGIDNGWLSSATYLTVAQKGWTGLKTKIDNYTDSKPRINSFAPAMSVQNTEALYVQAAYQGVSVPVSSGTQHPHGYAAVLMAASVMEFPLSALPVHFSKFTAKKNNDAVELSWKNDDENGVKYYVIERSADGRSFTNISTTNSTGNGSYTWTDNTATGAILYYRIKAVSEDEVVDYTSVLSIRLKTVEQNIQVSPNPIKNGLVNIVVNNFSTGIYTLSIAANDGKTILSKSLKLDEGTSVQTIQLPPAISKGLYYVNIKGQQIVFNKNILVQ